MTKGRRSSAPGAVPKSGRSPSRSKVAPGALHAKVATHEGQLELQAGIIAELLAGNCTDNRVRALQAAQRGLTICREIVTDMQELAYAASLDRGVTKLERQLGGQVGGVLTTDEAPPFDPSGGATH